MSWRAKRATARWSVILLILLISACQPTPKEDFVVNKETEDVYEGMPIISIPSDAIHEQNNWDWKQLDCHDHYKGADDSVEVVIHFAGRYLDEGVPVLRVSHHEYTSDEVKKYAQALMPSEKYYDPVKLLSRKTLEEWIKEASKRLKPEYYQGADKTFIDRNINEAKADIEYYESLKEDYGENADNAVTDWILKEDGSYYNVSRYSTPDEHLGTYTELRVQTIPDEEGNFGFLCESCSSNKDGRNNELDYYKANRYFSPGFLYGVRDVSSDSPSKLSEKETLDMIQTQLKEFGMEYMKPVSITNDSWNALFWFFPSYLGLEYITVQTESQYAEEHMPERLYVQVSGDEIYHIKLINATDVVIENDSLKMISKDEALAALKQYMQTVYTRNKVMSELMDAGGIVYAAFKDANVKVEITELKFGYVRIPIKDDSKEFRLVPSWVFRGNRYVQSDDHYIEIGQHQNMLTSLENILVINAIDGSYIDHYDGYLY